MKAASSSLTMVRRLTSRPSSCMSRNSMLPDRSTASIMSRPLEAVGSGSPSHWGLAAAITSSTQTMTCGHLRPALRISGDSVCSSCRRFMKLTCSAAERVLAAGNSRRNSQGSGSSTKHRGQANSNIVVSHPLAQFMEQGVAGLVAQLDLGAIEVGGQRLQDGPPGVRVAAAQIVEPGFAVQAGSSVLAALLEQLLDPDVDLRQPVTVAETRRDR